jgi:hypothetical protein
MTFEEYYIQIKEILDSMNYKYKEWYGGLRPAFFESDYKNGRTPKDAVTWYLYLKSNSKAQTAIALLSELFHNSNHTPKEGCEKDYEVTIKDVKSFLLSNDETLNK